MHDDVWCSANPESEEARIMDEYANFYFSDEVTSYLNSMLGEIPYDQGLSPSEMDEFSHSYHQYSDVDMQSTQIADPVPSDFEPFINLISPALLEELEERPFLDLRVGDGTSDDTLLGAKRITSWNMKNSAEGMDPWEGLDMGGLSRNTTGTQELVSTRTKPNQPFDEHYIQNDHESIILEVPEHRSKSDTRYRGMSNLPFSPRMRPSTKRGESKRDCLLRKIREQAAEIKQLMSQLESIAPSPVTVHDTSVTYKARSRTQSAFYSYPGLSQAPTEADLPHNDLIIAVMGLSGSGKSSFINMALGTDPRMLTTCEAFSATQLCKRFAEESTPFIPNLLEPIFNNIVRSRKVWRSNLGMPGTIRGPTSLTPYSREVWIRLQNRSTGGERILNLALPALHLLNERRRRIQDSEIIWRSDRAQKKLSAIKLWNISTKDHDPRKNNPIMLMARAHFMFAPSTSVDSDGTIAENLDAIIEELWALITREERKVCSL
ncbi:hypothetical protein BDZ94DRAFT_1061823 [Collybia nuda]|uniref:G domain-containing protein n=1 Tax=Collybia nuda TaxID=64659 RepID=A0A9P5XYJ0_9AGAR|nr:hypothetical protein BDZ94DRAFT_1061823 [Collybia nuda]